MEKFVILTTGRSGSQLLSNTLGVKDEILNFENEHLDKQLIDYISSKGFKIPSTEIHTSIAARDIITTPEYLDIAYSLNNGAKMLFFHMRDFMFSYFKENKIKPILLYRENSFHEFISHMVAERSNIYVLNDKNKDRFDQSPIKIDYNRLFYHFKYKDYHINKIFNNFNYILAITYEQLINDWERQLGKIFKYLNIDQPIPEKCQQKMITKNYEDLVIDYNIGIDFLKYCNNYRYTSNWFTGHIPKFQRYLQNFKDKEVNFLEIGSFEGRSAKWMIDNILTHPNSKLTCIDIFNPRWKSKFDNNICSSKCIPIIGQSKNILPSLNEKFDFIYIDGSHTKIDVIRDLVLSFDKLKDDGIIAIDDYKLSANEDCKKAIDSFLEIYQDRIEILHKDYQVWIKKI